MYQKILSSVAASQPVLRTQAACPIKVGDNVTEKFQVFESANDLCSYFSDGSMIERDELCLETPIRKR